MSQNYLSVSDDFAPVPHGRTARDGEFNAARFRDEFLIPALEKATKSNPLVVDIDEVVGYGASFLEEAFGYLVSKRNYTKDELHKKLIIKTDGRFEIYKMMIWRQIDAAVEQDVQYNYPHPKIPEEQAMTQNYLSISKDYTGEPWGRLVSDGEFSAERLREEFLIPALQRATESEPLIVDIDDVTGYSAAFIDEAFGALVSKRNFTQDDLYKILKIKATGGYKLYEEFIWDYIRDASKQMEVA